MKENPSTWKEKHTKFINSQFEKSKQFQERLLKTPNGKDKLINLYDIKNIKGYPKLN